MEEKTIEIGKEVTDAIAADVAKSFDAKFDELKAELVEANKATQVEKSKLSSEEEPVEGEVVSKYAKLDKIDFAAEQYKAWVNKDHAALKELNEEAVKSYNTGDKEKASYMNATTPADGGAIVPNRELLTDVFSVLDQYSEFAADLRTITLTEGTGIDVATIVQDVVMTEVGAEGGDKPTTKMVFGEGQVDVREIAGIAILTKKLVRQAAVNVYELLQQSFARAIARKRAEMGLTDAASGIIHKAGVNVVTTAAGKTEAADISWTDLKRMRHATPRVARQGAKYYISADLLEALDLAVDKQDRALDLVKLDANGVSGTFADGSRFAVEDGLGENGAPHAVYGATNRFGILVRQGNVENETFDTGTVVDGSGVSHNLLQQNKLAQRVAFYENVGFPIENAFTVLELATA